jgi:hypothetical protein
LLPEGYAHPQTRIGPVLVEVYAVMLEVSLGRGGEAHRRAATIDPASIPSTERRARHLVELARGSQLSGEDLGALHLLGQAVDASLETVLYSPPARALTRDLLRVVPASSREDAERIASRIGVQE